MKRLLSLDFVRFCLVGAGGFLINFALLTLFYKIFDLPILVSQLFASEIALFHNFLWHHYWTYKGRSGAKSPLTLLIQFHATSWVAIIGTTLLVGFGVDVLKLNYALVLVISSLIALFWNFTWTKFYIWKNHKNKDSQE